MLETYGNENITKLINFSNLEKAQKWIDKNKQKYKKELHIGTNLKDGYVIYMFR